MNLKLTFICLALLVSNGCKKKGKCANDPNDKMELRINTTSSKQFPGLPEGVFVNTFIHSIQQVRPSAIYTMTNEQFFINGVKQTDLFNPTYKLGKNSMVYTADCKAIGTLDADCPCGDSMKTAVKHFEVLDTQRIWIKKIEYWKQYSSPRPDVYLVINNFGIRSGASWNYDYANDGRKVWNIDDTLTIPEKYFNMSITAWDKDRVGNDEWLQNFSISAADVNNWETGVHEINMKGGLSFEIEKL